MLWIEPVNKIYVDDRVVTRHPDQKIEKADAIAAWNNAIKSRPRLDKNPIEYLAIGIDGKGRLMELVAIRNDNGDFLIYHAFTPPQNNAKRELGITERNDRR